MYNWNLKKHKIGNTSADSHVSLIVKDMDFVQANSSEEWINIFQRRLLEIKKTNSFNPEFGYKATPRNQYSLEVWKMKANGDFNFLMFTVTKNDSN